MKIVKRVGIIAFLLCLLIPVSVFAEVISTEEPYDYRNGLFDNERFENYYSLEIDGMKKMFDNDTSTNFTNAYPRSIKFSVPIDIDTFYIHYFTYQDYPAYRVTVTLENGENHEFRYQDGTNNRYEKVELTGVTEIIFYETERAHIKEFDIFGRLDTDTLPDRDGDGIPDVEDEYPDDPYNGRDSDGDGIPDIDDEYPDDPLNGMPDRDGDGIPDHEDEYPDDPTNTPPPTRPEEVPEVQNLQMETDGERVDLSWKNPPKYFDKAKIYRKDLGSNETAFNWNPFAPMKVSANADFKPLFETNGTEFSDLSIEPETEYEYKVTANYNGMESQGVTVLASVPKPPLINTDDVKLPFGIGELIKSGNGLLGLIGGFVLLALAFIFVPKVIAAIRGANTGNSRGAPGAPGRAERIGKQPKVTDRQMNLATGNGRQERAGRQPRLRDRQVKGV